MATSLSQQLQRLAAPQSSIAIADARSRASILFEPKEAATKDRRTIYDIGLSGLQELVTLNPDFTQFEHTLFNEATINLERAVEHSDINELLNQNIAKFMRHISPYLQLRPAHMCLEWLLRRFQVHEYNRNEVMALILPYHETSIFISVLQTMQLKQTEWEWLRSIAKNGKPLPKSAIINRATSLPAFLKFICKSTLDALTELGARASLLQTQLNFYTTVVVGTLQRAKPVSEWHISTLLEPLIQGLGSDAVDFVSSSYIIVAQLVTRAQLKPRLCNALVERVANCGLERLRISALTLLILIFDSQTTARPALKPETLLNMVRQEWLTRMLAALTKENIATQALCKHLLRDSVKAIQEEHAESNTFKQFLDRLVQDIKFSDSGAESFINHFLNAFVASKRKVIRAAKPNVTQTDIIELDSDEEMTDVNKDFQSWYSHYLYKLERQYPTAFDNAIKRALQQRNENVNDKRGNNRAIALKLALAYRLKSSDANATSIYETLYHYSPEVRLHAIKILFKNLQSYQTREQNYQLLKECLADRINDDCASVVAHVLELNSKDFVDILGANNFTSALFNILYKAQQSPKVWQPLIKRAVQHLTSPSVFGQYDNNLILLALMPILFPETSTPHGHAAILEILKSEYCAQVGFLRALEVPKQFEKFHLSGHRKDFLNKIANEKQTLTAVDLMRSIETHGGASYIQQAVQVTHLLLLLTSCLKEDISVEDSLHVFKQILAFSRAYKIKDLDKYESDTIPLQLYSDFVLRLIQHTKFGDVTDWSTPTRNNLQCALYIFNVLTSRVFEAINRNAPDQLAWSGMLKVSLDAMLPTAQQKIDFLSNFFMYDQLPTFHGSTVEYTLCRVRAFKLLQAVLRNKENDYKLQLSHILRLSCALTTQSQTLRLQTLDTLKLLAENGRGKLTKYMEYLLLSIIARTNELSMDHEQFALILFTILQPNKLSATNKMQVTKLRREYLQLICDDAQPAMFTAALLRAFKHVNDAKTLAALLPLANETIKRAEYTQGQYKQLPAPYNEIYLMIVERFDIQTVRTIFNDEPLAWQLFKSSFAQYDLYMVNESKLQPLPCAILETLTPEIYDALPEQYKQELIKLIVETVAQADNDSIFLAAHKLLKRCTLDCRPFVGTLQAMNKQQAKTPPPKSKVGKQQAQIDVTCSAWKQGIALLELLEHKRNLLNSELLIPALFDVLKACLALDEQSIVEYPKQLLLSTLHHCCQSTKTELQSSVPESSFHIEQVVLCLRATQNPQTQQIALLFLTHCASLYPQQVLHNIVAIFTFMGSSVVRQDDAFSFHIINKVIEQVVPILIEKQQIKNTSTELVIPVMKVFSDIILDVPEHRRLPLYTKFLQTLGPVEHLWQFLCVVFEAHVAEHEKLRLQKQRNKTKEPSKSNTTSTERRLEIAQQLTNAFDPEVIVETCVQLLNYLIELPITTERYKASTQNSASVASTEMTLFDVKNRNATQLRHYQYIIMQFLSNISRSTDFLHKVAQLKPNESLVMKPYYQNFIIKTLSYIAHVNNTLKTTSDQTLAKLLKVVLNHAHDVLDNAISLLSPEMFLLVVNSLMKHELPGVRKKVIEILISKLQNQRNYFDFCTEEHFEQLFEPLAVLVESINKLKTSVGTEHIYLQQTALIAIKLLSKLFGQQYLEKFKALLVTLTEILKERANCSEIVAANVVLTLVEISTNLKAHSLAQLPKFMPHIMDILRQQAAQLQQKSPDHISLAIIAGVQKLFEALPLFLGPYIVQIIIVLANISTLIGCQHGASKDQCTTVVQQKIKNIWSKIASEVPLRILAPSCQQAYEKMLAAQSHEEIGVLMQLLLATIKHNTNAELAAMQMELGDLFLQALQYRVHLQTSKQRGPNTRAVVTIEAHIIDAFVAWILKLSETTFRPMYSKVYEWAFKSRNAEKATMLTYFLLTKKMAEALKSLFVLFANDFIGNAASLLDECNTLKQPDLAVDEHINVELIEAILGTLYHIFLHDSNNFVNAHRFGVLVQPIVDQLENVFVAQNETLQQSLTTCIAQLAVAVSSDVQWKQLNYQVLMKTRANEPEVRILAFNCCVEIARKLGEDFSTLLPETVPFIAELLEDEHESVEKSTKSAVQELETILGESLQKYL